MRTGLKLIIRVFLGLLLTSTIAALGQTKSSADLIESKFGEVDGIKIHYLTAGHGPAVNPSPWLYPNLADVEALDPEAHGEVHRGRF